MARGCRTPASRPAQLAGNINFSYGNGSRLRFGARRQPEPGAGTSPYWQTRLNPGSPANQQTGFRAQNAVYTVNWTQNLAKSSERALALDVNLSYQTDRFIQSPFADGGPGAGTLGFYFSPIPLQYGFDFLDQTYDIGGQTLHEARLLHPQREDLPWRHRPEQRRLGQRAHGAR